MRTWALPLLAAPAFGWGPITHYQFACKELTGDENLEKCIAEHPDVISGDDFPDAFAFGNFILTSNCSQQFGAYHANGFATQMLLHAKEWQPKPRANGRLFNATAFAVGYASHMYSDDVGFFPGSGPVAPRGEYLDWLKTWVYMVAIDAYFVNASGLKSLKVPELPSEGADFIAASAAAYKANVDPKVPDVTGDQVRWCAAAWQQALRDKTAEALQCLTETWQHQIVEFSPFGAKTWQQAVRDFEPSRNCVSQVWQYYMEQVRKPGAKPGVVDADVMKYVQSLFASGKCTPTTASAKYDGGLLGMWPEAG
eukprot:TRINITY_DN997_c0_g1_i1.p1 TRINITY_DN997_c0_g1~~TRINITY_DN997_c0_g1_i1.p1  ORF type:complete len:310 (+),score=115.14 TRINITY_DN997_c0_g1_i1:60-989(+)